MSHEQAFRPSLAWRLAIAFALCAGATSLLVLYERRLGPAKIPVLIVTACSGFYFLKLLLEAGWYDATALPLERMIARVLIFLQVLGFLTFLGLRLFAVRHLGVDASMSSNQAMPPTVGRCDASLFIINAFPLQFTLALASGR